MEFIKGMDISSLPEQLESGSVFLDKEGNPREVFELLKENGVNSIRLRIWNEPENVQESGGYCNLEQTILMAKKIKQNGMSFFLDFHYSDYWADPGKQEKPKAWKELGFEELIQAVYDYTRLVLLRLEEEGAFPDMVQIGNEIRSGMLFPDGEVPRFDPLVKLVNAGIRAVRDVSKEKVPQVVIHLDQGGRYFYLRDWFDAAIAAGLEEFDVIGVSYYPFWHGTFAEFKETLVQLVNRYGKPVVIAETAHAWRCTEGGFVGEQQEKIAGFPATPDGQRKVMDIVMNITASLKSEMGLGIYYWEPVVLPLEGMGGWSSNMGIFGENGKALPALERFKFQRNQMKSDQVAKIYEPPKLVVKIGEPVKLPEKIKILYYDGSLLDKSVIWEEFQTDKEDIRKVSGFIPELKRTVQAELQVVENLEQDYNFIPNGNFEGGLEGFRILCEDDMVKTELHPEFEEPFPAPPIYYLHVESPVNFCLTIQKTVEGLEPGAYRLQVEYRGTNTTGVDVRLFAETAKNNAKETIIYPTDENWVTYQLPNIIMNTDKITIGMKIESPPIFGKIRNFTLTRQKDMQEDS